MDELTTVEESLRGALRHTPAPAGFTERVMAQLPRQSTRPATKQPGTLLRMQSAAWWSAAAAALLLAAGGGDLALHHHHTVQAQAAEAQVDLAMQLTSRALDNVNDNLDHSHAGRFTHLWNDAPR